MKRALLWAAMLGYSSALLVTFDFVYSYLVAAPEQHFRVSDPDFDHGLARNFAGHDVTSGYYKVFTNSLGFKDAAVREVPLQADHRRILLIGDSFTEGVGLPFEQTFAGRLYDWGRAQPRIIEFLNAGVATYSPVIYYRKIQLLIEKGLRIDEVIVFVDISDIPDESALYFCIDESTEYKQLCHNDPPRYASPERMWLQRNFRVIDATHRIVKAHLSLMWGEPPSETLRRVDASPLANWTVHSDTMDPNGHPHSIGIEGGIRRALGNMQKLADLLATRNVKLNVAVYPWMFQLHSGDQDSRQVQIWRDFCARNRAEFINLFSAFFAAKQSNPQWLEQMFIPGDFHFSAYGHEIIYREVARRTAKSQTGGEACSPPTETTEPACPIKSLP